MVLNKVNAFLMYQRRKRILSASLMGLFVLIEIVAVKATATPVVWEWLGVSNMLVSIAGIVATMVAHRICRNKYRWAVLGESIIALLQYTVLIIATIEENLIYFGFMMMALHLTSQFYGVSSELAHQINHHIGSIGTAEENATVQEEIRINRKISQMGTTICAMVGSAIAYITFTYLDLDMFKVINVVLLLCFVLEVYFVYLWYKYLRFDWDYMDVDIITCSSKPIT